MVLYGVQERMDAMKFASDPFMFTEYYAPRGQQRLMDLGNAIASQHLKPSDLCTGILGEAGSGKSLIVRGMFPGLQLTNDDEAVYMRPLPLLEHYESGRFRNHTYHMDIRFEVAFTQPYLLAEAANAAIRAGRRVVIEHFERLDGVLGRHADLLVGIGEEVIVARPNLFGPQAQDIANRVLRSIDFRRRVHTAEDIVCNILDVVYGIPTSTLVHGDVQRGFILEFEEKPNFAVADVERLAKEQIAAGLDVCYLDEDHIRIGNDRIHCTGPRIHVANTADIPFFAMAPDFVYNPINDTWLFVGVVDGPERLADLSGINKF